MKKNNIIIPFSILNFILGLIIGIVLVKFNIYNYTLDTKINIFDVINLCITSSIAIAIGWYITKKITEIRYEKEYIIDEIFSLSKQFKDIEVMTNSHQEIELSSILPKLTDLALKLEKLANTIEIFNLHKEDLNNLKNERSELHIALTNTDGRVLILDQFKKTELKTIFNKFDCDIKRFVHNINNS